jgi:hypothetical protein
MQNMGVIYHVVHHLCLVKAGNKKKDTLNGKELSHKAACEVSVTFHNKYFL